jgi:hypothetical protein
LWGRRCLSVAASTRECKIDWLEPILNSNCDARSVTAANRRVVDPIAVAWVDQYIQVGVAAEVQHLRHRTVVGTGQAHWLSGETKEVGSDPSFFAFWPNSGPAHEHLVAESAEQERERDHAHGCCESRADVGQHASNDKDDGDQNQPSGTGVRGRPVGYSAVGRPLEEVDPAADEHRTLRWLQFLYSFFLFLCLVDRISDDYVWLVRRVG